MISKDYKSKDSPFKSVLLAYVVLVLHLLLLGGVLFFIIFFRGVVNYMSWILLAGIALILLSAYILYRRIKKNSLALHKIVTSPIFRGQSIEVSVLGGMASFKIDRSATEQPAIAAPPKVLQLNAPEDNCIKELTSVAQLFENNLITSEEYNKAKKVILKKMEPASSDKGVSPK